MRRPTSRAAAVTRPGAIATKIEAIANRAFTTRANRTVAVTDTGAIVTKSATIAGRSGLIVTKPTALATRLAGFGTTVVPFVPPSSVIAGSFPALFQRAASIARLLQLLRSATVRIARRFKLIVILAGSDRAPDQRVPYCLREACAFARACRPGLDAPAGSCACEGNS